MVNPKKTNWKQTTLKALTIYSTSFALVTTPIYSQQAPQQQQEMSIPGILIGVTQQITGAIIQQKQQMAQMQQQIAMMNSLAPKTVPAKFFPTCVVPESGSATPAGVCESNDPSALGMIQSFIRLADTYEAHYSQMLSKAQHSQFPAGLQCIDGERKKMMSGMQRRQNSLQTLIAQLKKESQAFRDRNKIRLDAMDKTYAELHGLEGGAEREDPSNEALTRDYANYFSPTCHNVIGRETLNNGVGGGLIGIRREFTPLKDQAAKYSADSVSMRQDFEKVMARISSSLHKDGIDFFAADPSDLMIGNMEVSAITSEYQKQQTEFRRLQSSVQTEITEILGPNAITLPSLRSDASQQISRSIASAEDFFRKKDIYECVTGNKYGLALSSKQILDGLKHGGGNTHGNVHVLYRQALENILNSSSSFDQKIIDIRQLDIEYRNEVTVTYRDEKAQTVTETPYSLYQKTIARCEQNYHHDTTFQANQETLDTTNRSRSQDVQRVKKLLADYKNKIDAFPSVIQNAITDRVLNCKGRSLSSGSCSSGDLYDVSGENFCFPHADTCKSQVNACFVEADAIVVRKTGQIKAEAALFNQEAEALIATQEGILKQISQAVIADAEYLAQYFSGADFVYPADLFVAMPELSLKNGELLRGGGEINFDDLISKVESLQAQLATQADGINNEINEYMYEVQGAIEGNKKKWADIRGKCNGAQQAVAQAVAQANQAQAQAQGEQDSALGDFCEKFEGLVGTNNPGAGCSGPYSAKKLATEMGQVVRSLDPNTKYAVQQYNNICNQVQNEREAGTESSRNNERPSVDYLALCRSNKDDGAPVVRSFIREIASETNIPTQFRSHRADIIKYLNGDDIKLPNSLMDSNFGDNLAIWRQRLNPTTQQTTFEGTTLTNDQQNRVKEISGENNKICRALAIDAAKRAPLDKWETEYERNLKNINTDLNQSIRSPASTTTAEVSDLTREWQNIGENARNRCRAQHQANRNPFSGFGAGGLAMPSAADFQNLGLGGRPQ